MMEATDTDTTARRRVRFSLLSLLLFTALLVVSVSHFVASRRLNETQAALRQANNELGQLTIDDASESAAIALPTFGPMQWRWRVQLPAVPPRYQLRWAVDNVPLEGLPKAPRINAMGLFDQYARPIATGEPFILTLALGKNQAGEFVLTCAVPNRSQTVPLTVPLRWLESDSQIGWMTHTAGMNETTSVAKGEPLVLLRYRRGKQVPQGWTVETEPTDGIVVWIEPIDK